MAISTRGDGSPLRNRLAHHGSFPEVGLVLNPVQLHVQVRQDVLVDLSFSGKRHPPRNHPADELAAPLPHVIDLENHEPDNVPRVYTRRCREGQTGMAWGGRGDGPCETNRGMKYREPSESTGPAVVGTAQGRAKEPVRARRGQPASAFAANRGTTTLCRTVSGLTVPLPVPVPVLSVTAVLPVPCCSCSKTRRPLRYRGSSGEGPNATALQAPRDRRR